ncbi:hypothetical protein LCGC14_2055060 [marine sediment metagenome]|uniref:HhH-GPD domain-containing protein n=1 Tax=marine sediment metagenome TaxID=412755 RepID=A0A0F9FAC3_9ZZZZ
MSLHQIDKPYGNYKLRELEEFLVFSILDTACPYNMVCKAFDELKANDMTTRKGIKRFKAKEITARLRWAGYRFPTQQAERIKAFGDNPINLRIATREQLVDEVKGIGMKLASFFLRNTRGEEYAVLDVHTLRWLQEQHKFPKKVWRKMSYYDREKQFAMDAEFLGKSVMELDLQIWNDRRVGN